MPDLTDEELCLLSLSACEELGPATIAALRRAARLRGAHLHRLVALPAAELEAATGLPRAAVQAVSAIGDPRRRGRQVLDRLARLGAAVALIGRPEYPARLTACLGELAPPALYVRGDLRLLDARCVAIVGSRRPSQWAADAARYLAGELAGDGATVVSGGAVGIDTIAHQAALLTGATAFVPPMGLAQFRPHGVGRRSRTDGCWCVVSQFAPDSGWRTAHALMRNRTIVALSEAVVAFEPRDTGGTWHSSTAALGMRKPLYVVCASGPGPKDRGLRRLVLMGATALDAARMPDAAAFGQMLADHRVPPARSQGHLFGAGGR